jgi:hypothetical protein
MPYVAPPFPPRVPFVAPSDLRWSLNSNSCNETDLECRARANSARATIANRANAEEAKYNEDKTKYEAKWSGNRTAQGMPIAAGYESQYDSRGLYTGPASPAVSATKAGVAVAVQDARAIRIEGLISNAVASGTQCFSGISEVMTAPVCVAHRAAFFANRAKGMSINEAREAAINPPKPPTPKEAGTKLAQALDKHKKATDAVKKSATKPKPKPKPKPRRLPKPKGRR